MKTMIALFVTLFSLNTFAVEKMGTQAVEMYQVLSHPQVVECLRDMPKMVNVSIKRIVARCPGCNTYEVSGSELGIDTPSAEKTVLTIKGKAVPGTFRGFVQTYSCSIKTK